MQLSNISKIEKESAYSNAPRCSNNLWQLEKTRGKNRHDWVRDWSLQVREKVAHGWLQGAAIMLKMRAMVQMLFNRKRLAILTLGLFFSVGLMACKGQQGDPKVKEAASTLTPASGRSGADAPAPDLLVEDINGNTQQISALKGKVVFINFWATWCPPCREEMPTIDKLKTHFKDNKEMVFLMIDIDGNLAASSKYLKKKGYDLPVYKANGPISRQYLGQSIPTTVILDKEGVIVARVEGASDYGTQEVINGISQLLNK